MLAAPSLLAAVAACAWPGHGDQRMRRAFGFAAMVVGPPLTLISLINAGDGEWDTIWNLFMYPFIAPATLPLFWMAGYGVGLILVPDERSATGAGS